MHRQSALTLFELLIVIALIALISLPLYFSYTRSQANQSLRSSTEQLKHTLESAHVSAREARDKKEWGVKNLDTKSFALISGKTDNYKIEKLTTLEPLAEIDGDFEIWFDIGTGETQQEIIIKLKNRYDKSSTLTIYKTGVVDIDLSQ